MKIKTPAACSPSVSHGVPLPFRFGARAAYTEVAASRVPVCACHASGEGHYIDIKTISSLLLHVTERPLDRLDLEVQANQTEDEAPSILGPCRRSTKKSKVHPILTDEFSVLPSGGDTSYYLGWAQIGMGCFESYYSSHAGVAQPKLSLWEEGSIASTGGL